MNRFDVKKKLITEEVAKYLLEYGIKSASLRNIGEYGTVSNRMLLHYFRDKEEMITEALLHITDDLINFIKKSSSTQLSLEQMLIYVAKMLKTKELEPYIRIYLELISFSSKQEEPYFSIAKKIANFFSIWIEESLTIEDRENKEEKISACFLFIEGIVILNTLGFDDKIQNAISFLSKKR